MCLVEVLFSFIYLFTGDLVSICYVLGFVLSIGVVIENIIGIILFLRNLEV